MTFVRGDTVADINVNRAVVSNDDATRQTFFARIRTGRRQTEWTVRIWLTVERNTRVVCAVTVCVTQTYRSDSEECAAEIVAADAIDDGALTGDAAYVETASTLAKTIGVYALECSVVKNITTDAVDNSATINKVVAVSIVAASAKTYTRRAGAGEDACAL